MTRRAGVVVDLSRVWAELEGARLEAGMTQDQLSVLSGISQPAISRVFSGHCPGVSVATLVAVASALGYRVEVCRDDG